MPSSSAAQFIIWNHRKFPSDLFWLIGKCSWYAFCTIHGSSSQLHTHASNRSISIHASKIVCPHIRQLSSRYPAAFRNTHCFISTPPLFHTDLDSSTTCSLLFYEESFPQHQYQLSSWFYFWLQLQSCQIFVNKRWVWRSFLNVRFKCLLAIWKHWPDKLRWG